MTIRIVMTSYMPDKARLECAKDAVTSLFGGLITTVDLHTMRQGGLERIAIHISDDGSPSDHYYDLVTCARYFPWEVTASVSPRLGIGGSLNTAMKSISSDDLWLYTTDDWKLTDILNLDVPIRLLREQNYDYVRLGPIHAGLTGETRYAEGLEYWLHLHHSMGGFCFATRPFLATKAFYEKIGPFPEKLDAYDHERVYAERIRDAAWVNLAFAGRFDTRQQWKHLGDVSPVGKIQLQ